MSESPTGEMLEFFNALCEESSINFLSARNQDKVLALRRLIEHGPEVDEDTIRAIIEITACFDGKGVWGYDTEIGTAKEVIDRVANILRNAGISVTVKG